MTPPALILDGFLRELHSLFERDDGLYRVIMQFTRQPHAFFLLRGGYRCDVAGFVPTDF
ncbi:MAG: hypothetical protein Q8N46_06925 [Anaerolineales bacterium]|nr:hypothetical protein [Anaerolineales bacterium]